MSNPLDRIEAQIHSGHYGNCSLGYGPGRRRCDCGMADREQARADVLALVNVAKAAERVLVQEYDPTWSAGENTDAAERGKALREALSRLGNQHA